MKTILCYGDSNTWGFVPGSLIFETFYMERFARTQRWTGLLQHQLGANYHVVEEGLNGRTTNVDYKDIPGRNGKTFLPICLYTHSPIDLVALMLGTNDLKLEFSRTSTEIADAISELVQIIQTSTFGADMQSPPQILLINPPAIKHEDGFDGMFIGAVERGRALSSKLKKLADETGCFFLDAAQYVSYCELDGVHLDQEGHKIFASTVYEKIANLDLI